MAKSSWFSSSRSKRNTGIAATAGLGIAAILGGIFTAKKIKAKKAKKG